MSSNAQRGVYVIKRKEEIAQTRITKKDTLMLSRYKYNVIRMKS